MDSPWIVPGHCWDCWSPMGSNGFQGGFEHEKDVILVLNTAKGGVATAWMLYEMTSRLVAPKAILLNQANTILVQGAALANMAMVDRFVEGDVTKLIETGDHLVVDPQAGQVDVNSLNR